MGSHQAGRRLLAVGFVVVAGCSPSSEQEQLGAALGAELQEASSNGDLVFEVSAAEASCWGSAMAAELGVARWEELGVSSPGYGIPDDMTETEADLRGIYEALRECIPDREAIHRLISQNLQFLPQGEEPLFAEPEIDCLATELAEAGITPLEFATLGGAEPEVAAAYEACGP